ncbi:LOW QUALITY PROTEIN: tenascin-like [Bufo gargarizans]|uniref:LOW QUALITY PROTEIN: tenascin-like n=1 Tax=Bufo gargarizans TaxID=30331 RepID=UPI001CF14B44|nr:LOW QUALITY PROTEIN: tenascin-like [Bufo gargarizans]
MDHLSFWRVLAGLLLCCPYDLLTAAAAIKPTASKGCSTEKALTITHIYSAPGEDGEQLQTMESDDNKLVFRHQLRLQSPAADCQRNELIDDLLARIQALELGMKEMKEQYEGCCGAAVLQINHYNNIMPSIILEKKVNAQEDPLNLLISIALYGNCNGNGKYVPALGRCQCDKGWEGPDCSIKKCPVDCGEFGKCVDGACVCAEGYTGVDCREKKCAVDCRPNGRCVNGECVCDEGFMGADCKEKKCAVDCRPNGRCVNGKCVCDEGFMGVDCKEKKCAVDCRPNGRCVNGECVCDEGFIGVDCKEKKCAVDCRPNGRCVNGKCVCDEGFMGADCKEKKCAVDCRPNGRCVNGECVCNKNFTGVDCREKKCAVDCRPNGRCVNGKCVCDEGFMGADCKEKKCAVDCRPNGRCVNGKCVCDEGFMGADCKEKKCAVDCRPNGRCVNGKCVCDEGFMGADCKEKKCAVDCRPNGRCVNGECVCDEGFMGADCKEKKCAVDCRPNGRCVNGECVCDEGWEGPDCSQKSCPNNCANNGVCVNGVCQCASGFTGPDCSEKECLPDCGENGKCVDGVCQCNFGYTGLTCREEDCVVNCGENGRCDGGQCFCEEGFFGESCSEVMAVQNLRLVGTTEDSLSLSWDVLVDVDYYYISYYPYGDASLKQQIKVSADQDFYQIGRLSPSTLYQILMYQVKNGVTSDPAELQGQTDAGALGTLWVTEETEDSLEVEWENPNIRVDYFILKYAAQSGGVETEVQVSQSDDPKTRYLIKGLQPSTKYDISIQSVRRGQDGKASSAVGITGIDGPKNLVATDVGEDTASLSWEAAQSQIDRYILTYASVDGHREEMAVSKEKTSTFLTGLTPGIEYIFNVWAEKGNKRSKRATVSATTDIDAPKNLEASEITQTETTLTWTPPVAQIDGYILTYEDADGNRQEIELDAASKSFELKGLKKGTQYTVYLRAYKGEKKSRQATATFLTVTIIITFPVDCSQIRQAGNRESGIYTIYPGGEDTTGVRVYCDQDTDGGGWTVFQRRTNGKLDFYQRWRTYVEGFGDPSDEFWLGLEWLHKLTSTPVKYELRVDLRVGDESAYAVYSTFNVGTSRDRYKLLVGGYSGTAGDALNYHNGLKFTTWDKDNDLALTNCALSHRGAFWYKNCHLANPNGQYGDNNHSMGVNWEPWKGHEFSIPFIELKMRPLDLSA